MSYHPCRHSNGNGAWGNITINHGASANNTSCANGDVLQYHHISTQPAVVLDDYDAACVALMFNRRVWVVIYVISRPQDTIGADQNIISNGDAPLGGAYEHIKIDVYTAADTQITEKPDPGENDATMARKTQFPSPIKAAKSVAQNAIRQNRQDTFQPPAQFSGEFLPDR